MIGRILTTSGSILLLFYCRSSLAAPARINLVAVSHCECPNPTEVRVELARLIPSMVVKTSGDEPNLETVKLADFGSRYAVSVGGTDRLFVDEGRRCDDRVHAVALAIAMALEPPEIGAAAGAAPASPALGPIALRNARYPASLVDRPLTLPPAMVQPFTGVGITNLENGGTGETLSFGLDIGVSRQVQLGVFFNFPINPNSSCGTFLTNLQVNLTKQLNLRFDLGAQKLLAARFPGVDESGMSTLLDYSSVGFLFGVGSPLKFKLHKMFAITSGSNSTRGSGVQPLSVDATGQRSLYPDSAVLSEDVLSVLAYDGGGSAGVVTRTALTLPIGFLFQPHDKISLGIRSGYRVIFMHLPSTPGTPTWYYVPLSFDVAVNVMRQVDIGFTAFINGYVGSPTTVFNVGYADLRVFDIWAAARF